MAGSQVPIESLISNTGCFGQILGRDKTWQALPTTSDPYKP